MRKIAFLLFLFVLSNHFVFACKCNSGDDIKEDYLSTDVIIHAKVLKKEFVTFLSTFSKNGFKKITSKYDSDKEKIEYLEKDWVIKLEMQVLYTYKGEKLSKIVTVYTSKNSASCGYLGFEIGKEYQVYLFKECYLDTVADKAKRNALNNKGYWTHRCMRTKEFSTEEDESLRMLKNTK